MKPHHRPGSWHVTQHAVDRYIERFAPELSHDDARARLEEALPTATRMRENMSRGEQRWLLPELGVVAIVKPNSPNRVIVTIAPPDEPDPQDELARELALEYFERLRAR